jgi:integrase
MRRKIWPVCNQLGVPRFGWHCLYTFSTDNGNSGVAMPTLQSLLGHTHPETTMIYYAQRMVM